MTAERIDPVTLEVIRAALPAICDEMAVVLKRTAYNMFIYEVLDFSVAIVDANGDLVGQNRGGIPLFLADLAPAIRSGIEDIGRENFHPGDVIINNYAGICGQHLNNVIIYQPLFFSEKLVGFSVARGHWMDIGGSKVGLGITRTIDIFQEGLQFRNVKVYDRGQPNETFFHFLRDNLRRPDLAQGDLRAQMAACRLGEQRYQNLLQRYGQATVEEAVRVIAEQSEERARQAVARIPDGVYEAESFLDSDGINYDQTVPIKVRVIVKDTDMTIDFSEVSPQVQGPINSGTGGFAVGRIAFKYLTSKEEPANEGQFRPLKLVLPPGTFLSARPPAPMASWSMGLAMVLDTIFKALAPALPNEICAASKADQGDTGFFGVDPKSGRYWLAGNIRGGGWGGRPHEDGENATVNNVQGEITTAPVEQIEQVYPLLVQSHSLIPDSGGPGKFRGGLGTEWVIRAHGVDHVTVNISSEGFKCPPWGLWGGKQGHPNYYLLSLGDGKEPEVVTKRPGVRLPKEGWVALRSGGGGGWGDPLERDSARVLADVVAGYVSSSKAQTENGVVIDLARKQVDETATLSRREQLRRNR